VHGDLELPEALARRAPKNSGSVWVLPLGDEGDQPVRFYVYADMMEALCEAAASLGSSHAVLHGNFGVDDYGAFVEIAGFELMEAVDQPTVSRARGLCDRWILEEHQGRPMLGLFYSIPNSEGKMTSELGRIHLSLLNIPFQVIGILDPVTSEFGLYARIPRGGFVNVVFRWVRER